MADSIPLSEGPPLKDKDEEAGGTDEEDGETDEETGGTSSSTDSSDDERTDELESPIQLYKDQRELAQHALQGKNTIIFSVPGSGKTWIAMHIAWMHLQDKTKSPRKIVFMARTGALIKQQAETFQENLQGLKIKLISAQDGDEASYLAMYVKQNDIVCLTPQILINSLEDEVVKSLSEFSLMIFDECHHTKGETPYNQLMRKYLVEKIVRKNERLPQNSNTVVMRENTMDMSKHGFQLLFLNDSKKAWIAGILKIYIESPYILSLSVCNVNDLIHEVQHCFKDKIVGLTGSIGIGNARTEEDAVRQILELCANLDVRQPSVVDKHEKSLKKRTSIAKKEAIQLDKNHANDQCKEVILRAMIETEKLVEEKALMQPDLIDMITEKQPPDRESQEYNNWTYEIKRRAQLNVDDANVSRDICSCARYLSVYNSALEQLKLLHPAEVIKYFATKHQQEGQHLDTLTELEKRLYQSLLGVQKSLNENKNMKENRNVHILSQTLETLLKEKGGDSRAIVAVKTRATCRSLATYLNKCLLKSSIRVSPLYGKEDRNGEEGMSDDVQTKCLERFREGYYKVIVCTSVGNEGIDIPACNIVISYEYSGDEITSIQLKGRARKTDALAVTLGSEKILEQEKRNAFKEELMIRALEALKKKKQVYIEENVSFIQQEIMKETKMKDELDKLKKEMQTNLNQDLLCGRCNTLACPLTDVRKMGHDHIVVNSEFKNKIKKKIHKKPMVYNDINKKYKMYCKNCPNDWGIVGVKGELEYMILKIKNFKFRDQLTNAISTYKNWKGLNIAELSSEDIRKLNGRQEEEGSQMGSGIVEPRDMNVTGYVEDSQSPCEEMCEARNSMKRTTSDESQASSKKCKYGDEDSFESSQSTISCAGFPLKRSHDDTLSQPVVNLLNETMNSVGALVYSGGLGTVFRVGTKYIMTAWHNVKSIVVVQNRPEGSINASALEDKSVFVTFSPSVAASDRRIYFLTKYLVMDPDLDVAVLEIDNPDEHLPQSIELCRDDNAYFKLEDVSFIGYGHPQDPDKQLDPKCKILSPKHGQILKAQKWLKEKSSELKSVFKLTGKDPRLVDNGYGGIHHPDKMIFHCYMQQGSSGSPALTNNNPRSLKVVGILTHGLPEFFYNLDEKNRALIKDKYRFEVGTKMSSIYAWICNKNPTLASELFRTQMNV